MTNRHGHKDIDQDTIPLRLDAASAVQMSSGSSCTDWPFVLEELTNVDTLGILDCSAEDPARPLSLADLLYGKPGSDRVVRSIPRSNSS